MSNLFSFLKSLNCLASIWWLLEYSFQNAVVFCTSFCVIISLWLLDHICSTFLAFHQLLNFSRNCFKLPRKLKFSSTLFLFCYQFYDLVSFFILWVVSSLWFLVTLHIIPWHKMCCRWGYGGRGPKGDASPIPRKKCSYIFSVLHSIANPRGNSLTWSFYH